MDSVQLGLAPLLVIVDVASHELIEKLKFPISTHLIKMRIAIEDCWQAWNMD